MDYAAELSRYHVTAKVAVLLKPFYIVMLGTKRTKFLTHIFDLGMFRALLTVFAFLYIFTTWHVPFRLLC